MQFVLTVIEPSVVAAAFTEKAVQDAMHVYLNATYQFCCEPTDDNFVNCVELCKKADTLATQSEDW